LRSVRDLVEKIETFVTHYSRRCHPFAWTATSSSILEKLERLGKLSLGQDTSYGFFRYPVVLAEMRHTPVRVTNLGSRRLGNR